MTSPFVYKYRFPEDHFKCNYLFCRLTVLESLSNILRGNPHCTPPISVLSRVLSPHRSRTIASYPSFESSPSLVSSTKSSSWVHSQFALNSSTQITTQLASTSIKRLRQLNFRKPRKQYQEGHGATSIESSRSNNDEVLKYYHEDEPYNTSQTVQGRVKLESSQTMPRKSRIETILSPTARHQGLSDNSVIKYQSHHCASSETCENNDVSTQEQITHRQSRAIVNEVDPSLQRHPPLLPQLLHSDLKCPSRSFVVGHVEHTILSLVRENCFVEMFR